MPKCLYTWVELNNKRPQDDRSASLEHIVPYALGGSDSFAIQYCSKKANNDFGRDIDAPFIALPVVGFKRHELGLESYSRKVPDIIFSGCCVELNFECNIVFPYQKSPYADFGINADGGIDKGSISFAGSEFRLKDAVESLLKKVNRKGQSLLTQSLQPISSFQDAMASAAYVATGETLQFRLNFGHDKFFVPWSKGLIKMALGLGAKALGESWAFSVEADSLRACLLCDSKDFPPSSLKGSTVARIPPGIATMIDVRPGHHTLAVLPSEHGMTAYISLFGGQLFDAMIDLGNGYADVKRVNDKIPSSWVCSFRIDPANRRLATLTLGEVNARMEASEVAQETPPK